MKALPAIFLALAALLIPNMNAEPPQIRSAYVGGGCFWCTEALYQGVPGVEAVVSGYAGGTTENPTYEQVCSGTTGHAEVVRIDYDPAKISYDRILELFWKAHDPTTLNRQGADVGTQYRSIILYTDDDEKARAEASKAAAQKDFKDPIVTEIVPLKAFYPAEGYHQDFADQNPGHPYLRATLEPKMPKFRAAAEEKQ
jgi:methionine-S-sulfoxide reductase